MSGSSPNVPRAAPWQRRSNAGLICLVIVFWLFTLSISVTVSSGGNTTNVLNGIAALSASDVWAVGWASTSRGASPLIEHWNGLVWSMVPAPGKGDNSYLQSVATSSAKDIWVVGEFYQEAASETLIEHWNGTAWSLVPSPNGSGENLLKSIAVVSAGDVWAVGDTIPCPLPRAMVAGQPGNSLARARPATDVCSASSYHPSSPLIEHWDGHAWSIIPSPSPDPKAEADLSTVVAFGRDDIWASGSYNERGVTPADGATLIEHWDGTTWSIRTDFGTALGGRTWGTAFLSNRDIWGAEYATIPDGKPVLKHWDGTTWQTVAGPAFGTGGYFVGTMAGSRSDDLWAVGAHEPPQQIGDHAEVFTMHWNGRAWSLIPCQPPSERYIELTASISLSPTDAWFVGDYEPSFGIQYTFIEHWDGQAWHTVLNPNPGQPAPARE